MHTRKLAPPIFALCNSFLELLQFLCHHVESVDLDREQGVVDATDHPVCPFLFFCPHLEFLQLLHTIYRLPIIMEDGRGIQRLGVYLVAVVAQSDDDGVWVEYDLYILHLFDVPVQAFDGEQNEVVPEVRLEPPWDLVALDLVASLVRGEPHCSGCIWSLIRVIRIFDRAYKEVLIWVEIPFTHVAGGAAPQSARCQCTDWRSASHAAILALLLATAFVNCSSLHVEQTFCSAVCDALRLPKGDWQWDFARMTVFRSPNVSIDVLYVGLVGRGCSHVVRV